MVAARRGESQKRLAREEKSYELVRERRPEEIKIFFDFLHFHSNNNQNQDRVFSPLAGEKKQEDGGMYIDVPEFGVSLDVSGKCHGRLAF